jgi:hypothetical protein
MYFLKVWPLTWEDYAHLCQAFSYLHVVAFTLSYTTSLKSECGSQNKVLDNTICGIKCRNDGNDKSSPTDS